MMITQRTFSLFLILFCILGKLTICARTYSVAPNTVECFPVNNARNINPDTHLKIIFPSTPKLGTTGKIRIYDMADNRLVDQLDMSIPPEPSDDTTTHSNPKPPYLQVPYEYNSAKFTNVNTKPGTPSGGALPTPNIYQLTIIGGFTDGFHFFPVIIHNTMATIYPHNNILEYNKTYYVQIDTGVLTLDDNSFTGITGKTGWVFTTKKLPPPVNSEKFVVNDDGSGDFNTVQGAIDFIPDYNPKRITIFIKNGVYEEIVYFRNKTNITILGEDREKVIVKYANKESFNPHPLNISTNEIKGTFPSRRAAFSADHSNSIHLVNLTIKTTSVSAQAEGLLLNGGENIVYNVSIGGSGDALQSNGSAYYTGCRIDGSGDIILGRGPSFFKDCELRSSGGAYMWIRNNSTNHGNVFVNCKFKTASGKETELARAPTNGGKNYPYCEAVLLNCKLAGISPSGWGPIGGDASNIHYWEYNSTNISDGKPMNINQRHPASRQLTIKNDSDIISNYSKPAYVLGDWTPNMAPLILSQPQSVIVPKGREASFNVEVAAIPEASYQWYINGRVITGATNAVLTIKTVSASDAGKYCVTIKNHLERVISYEATLTVK